MLALLIFVCRKTGRLCVGVSSETYLVAVPTEAQMVKHITFSMVNHITFCSKLAYMVIACWGYTYPTAMLIVKNTRVVTSTYQLPHLRKIPPRPSWSWRKNENNPILQYRPNMHFEVAMNAYGTIEDKQP